MNILNRRVTGFLAATAGSAALSGAVGTGRRRRSKSGGRVQPVFSPSA